MLNGKFKHGQVKITPKQQLKHVSQMNRIEKDYLELTLFETICAKRIMRVSPHLRQKQAQENLSVDFELLFDTIIHSFQESLINYTVQPGAKNRPQRRVLLRSTNSKTVNIDNQPVKCNLCFVLDIDDAVIVTAYWNAVSDKHETMNWNRYTADLPILPTI